MAEVDLGKVRMTNYELQEFILQTNGGVKLGKDSEGNPGYIVTDPETGADTVIPFSSGGSGVVTTIEELGKNMNYWSSSSSSYTISLSDIVLEKDYNKFLLFVTRDKTNYAAKDTISGVELLKSSTATYEIKQLVSIGNLTTASFYNYGAWLLEGANEGDIVGIQCKFTINNSSTDMKYYKIILIGIN
ncbi:MAG: hypothetical protein J6D28_02740 [Bacilli bacterium]|nr:hypothetical protein [Bacilli bacterium]